VRLEINDGEDKECSVVQFNSLVLCMLDTTNDWLDEIYSLV
jgi:hypothetical protein